MNVRTTERVVLRPNTNELEALSVRSTISGLLEDGSDRSRWELLPESQLRASDWHRGAVASKGGSYSPSWWSDTKRLLEIVAGEFDGPLDLVLDDASHFYEPTRASFEAFFPLLRGGGFYVLEDWRWEIQPGFERPKSWSSARGLVPLVEELMRRVGPEVMSLTLYRGFAAVERA